MLEYMLFYYSFCPCNYCWQRKNKKGMILYRFSYSILGIFEVSWAHGFYYGWMYGCCNQRIWSTKNYSGCTKVCFIYGNVFMWASESPPVSAKMTYTLASVVHIGNRQNIGHCYLYIIYIHHCFISATYNTIYTKMLASRKCPTFKFIG